MSSSRPLPDAAVLEKLLLGQLPPAEAEALCAQLQDNEQFSAVAQSLLASDTLIETLRAQTAQPTPQPDARIQGLIARLCKLRPDLSGADADRTEAAVPAAGAASIDFLSPPQQPDEMGRLGTYRVLKVLGQGGMGVVLAAEDVRLKRKVALKVMKPELAANEGARQRFLREAEACAAVHSDHVITIYQVGEQGDATFLAMEYLEGMSLDDWLKKGRKATLAQTARMGRQIALGLAAAHERGLIHRDIKPGNIWLESRHQGRIKLLDFGLARGTADEVHLTQSGAIVGTPAYMAPEQARGEHVDHRVDLFSLGVVLYCLTTGQLPFRGDNTMSMLMSLATDTPRPPREINADIPPRLASLIERLLAKDCEQRPATAKAVADELALIEREATQPADERTVIRAAHEVSGDDNRLLRARLSGSARFRWLVVASLFLLLGGVAAAIVVIIRDKQGNKIAEINVPPGGSVETKDKGEAKAKVPNMEEAKLPAAPLSALRPGEPLSPSALVQHPAKLPGVRSWSIEKRDADTVTAVAYRPDGKRLAVGSTDGSVRIWETQTGRLVQVLVAATRPIVCLAWSRDGRILATGTREDKTAIQLWEMPNGRLLRRLDAPQGPIQCLAWSPEDRLVLGAARGAALTWSVMDGKLLREVPIADVLVAYSPDGKRVAGWRHNSGYISVYDRESGKEVRKFGGGQLKGEGRPAVSWSPNGKQLACGGATGVWVWDAKSGEEQIHVKDTPFAGTVSWSAEGRPWTRVGINNNWGNLVEVGRDAEARSIGLCDLWSPDGKTAVGLDPYSGVIHLYAATGKRLRTLSEGERNLSGYAWLPRSPFAAVTRYDRTAALASVDNGHVSTVVKDVTGPIVWSPDGKRWATGGPNHAVLLWENDGKVRIPLNGHHQDITWLAWSPDGKRLASFAKGEKRGLLWDTDKGEQIRELGPWPAAADGIKWSSNGLFLIFNVAEVGWHFWDVEQNKLANDPKQWQVDSLAFAPHARTAVVLTSPSGVYQLRDLATGKEQRRLPHLKPRPPVLSADGHLLAIPTDTGVELWRGDLKCRVRTLHSTYGTVSQLDFSADGKLVAGFAGQRLHVWETDTGRLRGILLLGEKNNGLTIAPDGQYTGNEKVDRGIVVVVQKDDGTQELLEPADFEQKYGWKNEPDKVHLLKPLPPLLTVPEGQPMGPLALVREPAELPNANSWTIETVNSRGQVKAIAYRPDGKLLATGGGDGTIRIWDTAEGKLVRMLVGDPVDSLSWSKDGKVLTAGNPKAGREWDVDTGRLLRRIAGIVNPAVKEARSPDGKQTAKIEATGVHLYDADGKRTQTLEEGNGKQPIVRLDDANGFPLGVRLPFDAYGQLAVTADGHYRGNARVERAIRMVVQKRDGSSETLTVGEFEQKYGFKNDPDKVRPIDK